MGTIRRGENKRERAEMDREAKLDHQQAGDRSEAGPNQVPHSENSLKNVLH